MATDTAVSRIAAAALAFALLGTAVRAGEAGPQRLPP
jgi:hypothetical protein